MARSRIAVLALVLVVAACQPGSPTPPVPDCRATATRSVRDVAYRTVRGVDPTLLSLDLHLPVRPATCGPTPVVVWVHGGAFAVGDKANQVADKVRLARTEGWALVSVNYRLSPNPPSDAPGSVRHPTHVQDVTAAVAWVRRNAEAHRIDAGRLVLMGHSAGAFLVSLAATDPRYVDATCAVSLDTRYDIAAEIAEGGAQAEAMYRNAFGDDPAVWRDASPLTHAGAGDPPFLLVTRGQADRRAATGTFATALRRGGTSATVVDASPLSHAEVNAAVGRSGDTVVTPPLVRFVRGCVG